MAKVIVGEGEREVEDGSGIKDACDELGIPFGCRQGNCGTCKSDIIEGGENLSEKNDKEKDMGLEEGERLCCQAIINHGTVKLKSALF